MSAHEQPINPLFRQVLELGPTLAFFLLYLRWRDDEFVLAGTTYSGFIVAALAFVPILLVAMAVLWWRTRSLSRLQVFTFVMVVFFGGLTAWLNDERFFKIKTTIVYAGFATVLGAGLLRRQSWLAWILSDAIPLSPQGWMILTRRLTLAFALLALANELVWRSMSTDTWVKVETFGFPLALMGFLWYQLYALRELAIRDADQPTDQSGPGQCSGQ